MPHTFAQWVPGSLSQEGLPAVYNPSDIVYTRRLAADGQLISVIRRDGGLCAELFPTADPKMFEGGGWQSMEDRPGRVSVAASDIGDPVLLALAQGSSPRDVLPNYTWEPLGAYPSGSYFFEGDAGTTFIIKDIRETEQ
ncbi:MAG: hypothetical protein ABIE94_03005 [archaeon]